MSLTECQFEILHKLNGARLSQRALSAAIGMSIGAVNAGCQELEKEGLISDGAITDEGVVALEPYRVQNAVILAAGLSSRLAPITYDRPKGMLYVRGEVLIERQIRQLRAAGVQDIYLVVGYKKEEFFYLEEEFGVKLITSPDYMERNNHSSIWAARNVLGNSYVCSSDNYFTQNPFSE